MDGMYDAAFHVLGRAVEAEENHHAGVAIESYLLASRAFRGLWASERVAGEECHGDKMALLVREIRVFEASLVALQQRLPDRKAQADSLVELAVLQDELRLGGGREETNAVAEVYCLAAERYIALGLPNATAVLDHVAYLKGVDGGSQDRGLTSHFAPGGSTSASARASASGLSGSMATLFGGGGSEGSSSTPSSSTLDSVPGMLGCLPDHNGLPTATPVGGTFSGPLTGLPPPPAPMPTKPLPLPPPSATAIGRGGGGGGGGGLALSDREVAVLRHSSTVDGRVFQVRKL